VTPAFGALSIFASTTFSQLAGFAKRDDLAFFLKELCGAEYSHEPMLAPTSALLDAYRKQKGGMGRI